MNMVDIFMLVNLYLSGNRESPSTLHYIAFVVCYVYLAFRATVEVVLWFM